MRTYNKHQMLHYSAPRKSGAEPETVLAPPENPLARAAWEWNNALQIAAERMWEPDAFKRGRGWP